MAPEPSFLPSPPQTAVPPVPQQDAGQQPPSAQDSTPFVPAPVPTFLPTAPEPAIVFATPVPLPDTGGQPAQAGAAGSAAVSGTGSSPDARAALAEAAPSAWVLQPLAAGGCAAALVVLGLSLVPRGRRRRARRAGRP
jgi:hypothetical protein